MKMKLLINTTLTVALLVAGFALAGCATKKCCCMSKANSPIAGEPFGQTLDGTPVEIYTLRNANGMTARILTYGGIVQSLTAPDKNGNYGDVVLGFDSVDGYLTNSPYFGALIGRYANRIAMGHFNLDGQTYTLAPTTGRTRCTAASEVSTSRSGKWCVRKTHPKGRNWNCPTPAPTARRVIPAR